MTVSRRDFLGQIACALAVAGVATRIPAAAFSNDLNESSLLRFVAVVPRGSMIMVPQAVWFYIGDDRPRMIRWSERQDPETWST